MTVPDPAPQPAAGPSAVTPLPDDGSVAAAKAVRRAMRGSYTAEILADAALAAAAPALRAQGAAAERARLAPIIREFYGKPTGEMIAIALERGQL